MKTPSAFCDGDITDVPGVRVGNASDFTAKLPFRARMRVGVAIFPSMPRVVPNSVILPRCLEGLNVFCFVFFSYLSPAAYGSGKSARNKVVAQFSRKNGTSIGSAQDR